MWPICSSLRPTTLKTCKFAGAGAGQPQNGLVAPPASRSYEGGGRRHRTTGASLVVATSEARFDLRPLLVAVYGAETREFVKAGPSARHHADDPGAPQTPDAGLRSPRRRDMLRADSGSPSGDDAARFWLADPIGSRAGHDQAAAIVGEAASLVGGLECRSSSSATPAAVLPRPDSGPASLGGGAVRPVAA